MRNCAQQNSAVKISTNKPYKLIYSLYQHEYLGYLIDSFIIQLDDKGRLSFLNQRISSKNAKEFSDQLDDKDFELIQIMDSIQQEAIIRKFYKKKIKPEDFFLKIYDVETGDKVLQEQIDEYLKRKRSMIMELLPGKNLYEMGRDGEPAWKKIEIQEKKATVLFHFRRNKDNTHYFPTIKHNGEKIDFQYKGAYILCKEPAWMVLRNKLYGFEKNVDGHKLIPFLNKKFIVINKKVEEVYFKKFVAPLVKSFDVYAIGFDIITKSYPPNPLITISNLQNNSGNEDGKAGDEEKKILIQLSFCYAKHKIDVDHSTSLEVKVEKKGNQYTFLRLKKDLKEEKRFIRLLKELSLPLKNAKCSLPISQAFDWIYAHRETLGDKGFEFQQNVKHQIYSLAKSELIVEVQENIDWFDIKARVTFGNCEVPFYQIRNYILKNKREFELPNGETAVIPETWFTNYSELFAFTEHNRKGDKYKLRKHHLSLVMELKENQLADVSINDRLERLQGFERVEDFPLPENFKGKLRPYQKAGFNWLKFLRTYNFGGCLADDMGLGKTVQTLAFLQAEKEGNQHRASLLIMPTSLIYNWEMEAKKFTPDLKLLIYTGTVRIKNERQFDNYDLILTSYGIARIDAEILEKYIFNYIILDESQAIKNPDSRIAKAVKKLKSRSRLILTGTPIENSTLDLWSQMSFINPGLLGNRRFFKSEYLLPIEKNSDERKTQKLYTIIRPFILRRQKSQVATELPRKVINTHLSSMTTMQEDIYEKTKSFYRNKLLEASEKTEANNRQFLLLQGLTKLRQIANHPKMVEPEYQGDSGKMEDVIHMLKNIISEGHKLLVFSQFVKQLSILRNYLSAHHLEFAYLDGSTKDRESQVRNFQENNDLKLFLISLKAGGLGLNLTSADYVFLLDPWWNPAVEAQAIDRAHRIGQENKVFIYKFIAKNTVEEKIIALQERKTKLARELISVEESFVKNLSKDDIELLLN